MERSALDEVTTLIESARQHRHGATISIGGQSIRFCPDDPAGLRVARTILGPYCDIERIDGTVTGGGGPGDSGRPAWPPQWTVTSARVDDMPGLIARLAAGLTRSGLTPTAIRRWPGDFSAMRYDLPDRRSIVLHERPFPGLTVFLRDECELHYLRATPAFDASHTEHVLKYPLRTTLRQAGLSQVHAAGCVFRDRGLLIMGEKASGKSTLLAHLMSSGARQVSNDLSFVSMIPPGGLKMIAFPHITRMAPGTISDNAMLRDGLAREERSGDYLRSPVFNGGKEEFYFPVLQRIWGKDPVCRSAPLDAIIFPALDLDCGVASGSPLSRAERDDRVRRSLVTDPPLPDWLPFMSASEFRALAESAATALLAHDPPAYEVRFGAAASNPAYAVAGCLSGRADADGHKPLEAIGKAATGSGS